MNNILVTGKSGFLLRNSKFLNRFNLINLHLNANYTNIDTIIHFASPSDSFDFKNKEKTAISMVDLSLYVLQIARENNAKFIFASSEGAENPDNSYTLYKRWFEQYLLDTYNNNLILRIPRVYGKDRSKGLMKKIKENLIPENDKNNLIEYIDIEDFVQWFEKHINTSIGIIKYDLKYRYNTINELKKIYT
jgi:nucleoside-diphosphate-sugar epimerase